MSIEIKLTAEQHAQIELQTMTLDQFLASVGGSESGIIEYKGAEAKAAVEQNGYALLYVHEQTPEICKAAVEQNGYALQYVNKAIFGAAPVIFIAGAKYSIEKVL